MNPTVQRGVRPYCTITIPVRKLSVDRAAWKSDSSITIVVSLGSGWLIAVKKGFICASSTAPPHRENKTAKRQHFLIGIVLTWHSSIAHSRATFPVKHQTPISRPPAPRLGKDHPTPSF